MFPPPNSKKMGSSFYENTDVVAAAKALLGKTIVTSFKGIITAAKIVETEAYNGIVDKASHAYNGRRTKRTEIMYSNGGTAYVYLIYGIHYLFNVVTNTNGVPHAVLVRAAEPVWGIETMLLRTGKPQLDYTITRGPGNVSKALGISTMHTGYNLLQEEIYLLDDDTHYDDTQIVTTPRIGVAYAAEDAKLPYRFYVKGNKYVSGKAQ